MIFFEDENLNEETAKEAAIKAAEKAVVANSSFTRDAANEIKYQVKKKFGKKPEAPTGNWFERKGQEAVNNLTQAAEEAASKARQERLKLKVKYNGPKVAAGAAAAGAAAYAISDRNKKSNWKRNGCDGIKNEKEKAACQKYLGPDKITAEDKEK